MPPEPNDFDREDAPFLPSAESSHRDPKHHDDEKQGAETPRLIDPKLRFRLMVTLFTMILAVEVGAVMAGGPMTRIYESIACREYFAENDPRQIGANGEVEESLCKIKEVQTELAAVKGYMEFFDGLLSIFMAIPYGLLADRRGRKPTLCLSIPGFTLNTIIMFVVMWYSDVFPLRAVWISCLAWLFGGGPVVAFAIIWTMMSDVTTEEERASMFFKFGVASMGADFASTAASSWLMDFDPWIPLIVGWVVVFVGMLGALTLPETMHAFPAQQSEKGTNLEMSRLSITSDGRKRTLSKEYDGDDLSDAGSSDDDDTKSNPLTSKHSILTKLKSQAHTYLSPYSFIVKNKRITLLLTAFLVYRLSRGSSWFLIQYISVRYDWSLAEANFLMSFKPALTIPLFLIVLPAISRYLLRTMKTNKKDLQLARVSIIFLALGTLGIGLSPSIATLVPSLLIQTAGSGFVYLTRSLITTLVEREETARLFTIIEVLQSVGNVIASLAITAVFQIGLELGGVWIGLAWMMTSTAFTLVGTGISPFIPIPSPSHGLWLPVNIFLFCFRLPILIFLCVGYFLVAEWLPIGSYFFYFKKAWLTLILATSTIVWSDINVDGVRKGQLFKENKDRMPGPGDVIACSFTSPIDAIYLAWIFDTIFTASYPNTRKVEHISLLQAILRAFSAPQISPPAGAQLVELATLTRKYPNRIIVTFPECTTTNGSGVLPLSPCLLSALPGTRIFPFSLRYTPVDIVTPLPRSYLSFSWALMSNWSHWMRIRVGKVVVVGQDNGPAKPPTRRSTYDTNLLDILESDQTDTSSASEEVITPSEKALLDKVADSLAYLAGGKVKRVDVGVKVKKTFVRSWERTRQTW
ncbi:MFS general substrate transporter [Aspergillus ambiguus]|uniref:MFS general substrate transporter n=1 Tax=Aspergillus ambiguus TaxID=176160 RepID=UPI003CCE23D4